MDRFWRDIDWTQSWLDGVREDGRMVCGMLEDGASVAQALTALAAPRAIALSAGPLRFVPQVLQDSGEAYESFIHRTAQVPTRDGLHDFFNGLVWLAMPRLKRSLNEAHAAQIAQCGVSDSRGPLRDALTLFDENGALWQAPALLVEALRLRRWHELFVTHRALWRDSRLVPVGHALMEKLVRPRKEITAHLWCVPRGADWQTVDPTSARPLALPLLGIPGWWPANDRPGFYDDPGVFRPARG